MGNASNRLIRGSIKGPHSLDVQYVSLFLLIAFPMSIYFEGGKALSGHDLQIWVLAIALGWLAMLTYLICLRLWWVMRQRPTLSFSFLLLLSGTGGAIDGVVVGLIVGFFDIYSADSFLHHTAMSFISSLCWLPMNASLVSSVQSFTEQREDLLQRLNTLRAISFRQSGLAQKVRKVVEDEVIRDLNWSRTTAHMRFQSSIESDTEHGINPQLLKRYAGEELRTMSHNLWARSQKEIVPSQTSTEPSIRELFKLSLHLPPISIWVYCLLYGSAIIPIFWGDNNSPMELLNATFVLICFYFLMVAGERLYKRFPEFSPQFYTLRIVMAVYLPFFILSFINPDASFFTYPHSISFIISSFLLITLFVAILTLGKASAYSQDEIIAALDKTTKSHKAQVNLAAIEIASVSRQWAHYIHGNLQSRLLAAAAILEQSVEGTNVTLKEAAIVEATKIMSGDFEAPESSNRSLLDEIYFQVAHWQDLIEIEIDYTLEKDPAWVSANDFGAVVEQAVANAFRHGQATKVVISIHLNIDGWVECNFTDNGNGMATGDRLPGLGSSIFDSLAWGNWSLRPGPGGIGTCLHMIIPALELPPARGGSSVG